MNIIPRKLYTFKEACSLRDRLREDDRRVVLTNGCFDLLHAGHVHALENAAKHGDSLWIALNSDQCIKRLKGASRPIFDEITRAYILSALECISGIFTFDSERITHEILLFKPDVYVKSEDYSLEKLDKSELRALRDAHVEIRFVPFLPNVSTTETISAIKQL